MGTTTTPIDGRLLASLHFDSVEDAGREMLFLTAKARLSGYREEEERFEKKYGVEFETFQARVNARVNEEVFEEEDDLMDWRYVHEAAAYWSAKVAELAP